jgi:hypothetical protein
MTRCWYAKNQKIVNQNNLKLLGARKQKWPKQERPNLISL